MDPYQALHQSVIDDMRHIRFGDYMATLRLAKHIAQHPASKIVNASEAGAMMTLRLFNSLRADLTMFAWSTSVKL